jgi:hypothetical protein
MPIIFAMLAPSHTARPRMLVAWTWLFMVLSSPLFISFLNIGDPGRLGHKSEGHKACPAVYASD